MQLKYILMFIQIFHVKLILCLRKLIFEDLDQEVTGSQNSVHMVIH